ncbi:MAG: ABC transporter ATP-binding protein, partial [Lachnospiraceae bacterium]|nr:ABC transporter ATP-binding protein [Lachnospiraceae bacterium]
SDAYDVVMEKGGLRGPCEQGGRNFSGGQRQRLTIARALVSKPRLLILDDSSSALDFATDAKIRASLAALPWNMTVFTVTQRAATAMHQDRILVLDEGRLVGTGTHEELIENCPVYREIVESQT